MFQKFSTVRPIFLLLRLIWALICLAIILALAFPIGFYGMAMYIEPGLPKTSELKTMPLEMPLQIYTADHKLIGQYGNTFSMPIDYQDLPKPLINAFLAAEDDSFFEHSGISVKGLGRAITQILSDSDQQTGGSTITQQVVKNYFLTPEQTFERKLTEMFLARRIETEMTKEEIMTLYVNKIYLGQGAYGIKAGARRYYNKELNELTLAEMAMLAGLPKAPSEFNPVVNPERALERRNWILQRMREKNYISASDYQEARASDIGLNMYTRPAYDIDMPDLAELARTALVHQYGNKVMNSGWKVVLTIDTRYQLTAENAINGLRGSYRGRGKPTLEAQSGDLRHFPIVNDFYTDMPTYPAKITKVNPTSIEVVMADERTARLERPIMRVGRKNVRWQVEEGNILRITPTNAKETAWTLVRPHIQGALASVNPETGAVIALVGGLNTKHTNFNRAVQGYRQPGSTIKPIFYAALMEHNKKMTPESAISNSPQPNGWPKNAGSSGYGGYSSLRSALAMSYNTSAVNVLKKLGVERGITMMASMGLDKDRTPPSLAIGLGAAEATPLQMATAYATFVNGGHRIQPYIIEQIYSLDDDIVYQANPLRACALCFNTELDKTNAQLAKAFEDERKEQEKSNKVSTDKQDTKAEQAKKETSADKQEQAQQETLAKSVDVYRLKPKAPIQYTTAEQAPRILSPKTAYHMADMLQSAMYGTGKRATIGGRSDIGGKTGTTNQSKDVWFAGVHPTNSAVVWVGFDNPIKLGEGVYGGTLAAPIWRSFMASYLSGKPNQWVKGGNPAKSKQKSQEEEVEVTEDTPAPTPKETAPKPANNDIVPESGGDDVAEGGDGSEPAEEVETADAGEGVASASEEETPAN